MAVRVKICGITNLEDAYLCVEEGADALGFIFYPPSPRSLSPYKAKKIIESLPCFIQKVGVFVNEEKERVFKIAEFLNLDVLQFHGQESFSYVRSFKKRFKVIKSFFPKEPRVLSLMKKYKVDGFLLDIPFEEKLKRPFGVLDYQLIKKIAREIKFLIISGGLNLENIERLLTKIRPYAVDVCRGVEVFTGKKDRNLVREFIRKVKNA